MMSCLKLEHLDSLIQQIEYEKFIRRVGWEFPEPVKEFYRAGLTACERLIMGGNRTGKTTMSLIEYIAHLIGIYPHLWEGYMFTHPVNGWIMLRDSKYFPFMYDSLFSPFNGSKFSLLPKNLVLSENRGNMSFKIKNAFGGVSNLKFKSAESGREKLQSERLDLVLFDEEPPGSIISEVRARLVPIKGKSTRTHCMYAMYPGLGMTRLVHDFWYDGEDRIPEKTTVNGKWYCHISMSDVKHISEEAKIAFEKSIPEEERDARVRGIPYIGKGLIYPFSRGSYVAEQPNGLDEYLYGLDVGYTNQTALLAFKYCRHSDTLYCVDEYYKNKKSISELCEEWSLLSNEAFSGLFKGAPILCDPAIKQRNIQTGRQTLELFNEILNERGLYANFVEANNRKEVGIEKVRNMIRCGRLKLSGFQCPGLMNEMSQYAYSSDGKIPKGNDHALDALRYACSDYQIASKVNNLNVRRCARL